MIIYHNINNKNNIVIYHNINNKNNIVIYHNINNKSNIIIYIIILIIKTTYVCLNKQALYCW